MSWNFLQIKHLISNNIGQFGSEKFDNAVADGDNFVRGVLVRIFVYTFEAVSENFKNFNSRGSSPDLPIIHHDAQTVF